MDVLNDERGEGAVNSRSIFVFFLFYFSAVMLMLWMVEGITPAFLTTDAVLLGIGGMAIIIASMATAFIMEKTVVTTPLGGVGAPAHVSAWHTIRFGMVGAIALVIGYPLWDGVNRSAMFEPVWLSGIFIIVPFIVFSMAAIDLAFSGGGD